jgi:hypothetical protein
MIQLTFGLDAGDGAGARQGFIVCAVTHDMDGSSVLFFLSIRLIVLRVSLWFWTSGFAPCSAEWPRFIGNM